MLRYGAQTGTLRRVPVVVVIQVARESGVESFLPRPTPGSGLGCVPCGPREGLTAWGEAFTPAPQSGCR